MSAARGRRRTRTVVSYVEDDESDDDFSDDNGNEGQNKKKKAARKGATSKTPQHDAANGDGAEHHEEEEGAEEEGEEEEEEGDDGSDDGGASRKRKRSGSASAAPVSKRRWFGPGRGRWKRRRFQGAGTMEEFTTEVLRVLQTKGPLSFAEIQRALPRQLRELDRAQSCIERVLEICRATPLVNLVRNEPNGSLLFAFVDGNKQSKPIDIANIRQELVDLDVQEEALRKRVNLLKAELARLHSDRETDGGQAGAAECIQRVVVNKLEGPFTAASRYMYQAALRSLGAEPSVATQVKLECKGEGLG